MEIMTIGPFTKLQPAALARSPTPGVAVTAASPAPEAPPAGGGLQPGRNAASCDSESPGLGWAGPNSEITTDDVVCN